MATPPAKKKKPAALGIELLLGEEEDESSVDEMAEDDDEMALDEFAEEDELAEEGGEDPFADEEDDLAAAPDIDPEQAALAEQLGFTEPEQQQALIDLISLVLSSDTGGAPTSKDSGALPPLPEESVY